ncbi:hypothetical protein OQA88_5699 [Cercophora sp. LCS_1]
MWSHGFCTLRIDNQTCKPCVERYTKVSDKFTAIKQRLQALRKDLERRTHQDSNTQREITQVIVGGLREEEKPVVEADPDAQVDGAKKPNKLREKPHFQVREDLKHRPYILPLLPTMPYLLRQNTPRSND